MKWKEIPGYEGLYEVSDEGVVRSIPRKVNRLSYGKLRKLNVKGGVLYQSTKESGHKTVGLWKDNKCKNRRVHDLVMIAFIGERNKDLEIRHLDGDPSNNYISNLRYGTHTENMQDMARHGRSQRGEKQWNSSLKIIDVKNIRSVDRNSDNIKMLAAKYNVHPVTIRRIIRRERWGWLE